MSFDIINEDLRSIKTKRALYAAMFSLLERYSFRKITIKGICEEASISRAAFYAHFIDKYDLLEHWLEKLWPESLNKNDTYEQIEKVINRHVRENMLIFENVLCDADNETLDILFDYILSIMNLSVKGSDCKERHLKNVVLTRFYVGGLLSYFTWQIENKFPSDVPPMNRYLYEMIHELQNRAEEEIWG